MSSTTLSMKRRGLKRSTLFAIVWLPAVAVAQLVTVEFRSTLLQFQNEQLVLNSSGDYEPIGPAYPPASIPFSIGDEIRAIVTYDLSSAADPCDIGCSRVLAYPAAIRQVFVSVGVDRMSFTSHQGLIQVVSDDSNERDAFVVTAIGGTTDPKFGEPVESDFYIFFNADSTCLTAVTLPSPGTLANCVRGPYPNSWPYFFYFQADSDQGNDGYRQLAFESFGNDGNGYPLPTSYMMTAKEISDEAAVGSNVPVAVVVDGTSLLMNFDQITSEGSVSVVSYGPRDSEVPPPPSAFDFGGTIYHIETSAQFTGGVEVCLPWSDPTVQPTMLHYTNGAWESLPTTLSGSGVFCATTTSFSLFALVVPGAALSNLQKLITSIKAMNLKKGLSNSLDAKLEAARNALDDLKNDNDVAAFGSMTALLNEIAAQKGKQLTNAEADTLTLKANDVISHL